MSLLDDENILIENVKESCDLIKPLEKMLEEFSIINTINTAASEKCEEFFNNIRCIDVGSYEWLKFFDRFILYNKEAVSVSAVFVIFFEKAPQFYTGYFNSQINLKIAVYNHDLSEELLNNLISLFDLNNNQIWKITNNFDYNVDYIDPVPYTTYKYIKNETQLWYTSEESH